MAVRENISRGEPEESSITGVTSSIRRRDETRSGDEVKWSRLATDQVAAG